jgi:hypothetical protein
MQITKTSPFSGKEHTMEIDYEQKDYDSWQQGTLIQNAMPYLTADERKFLITGITPTEWDETFGEDNDSE